MPRSNNGGSWLPLDRELGRISRIELAAAYTARPLVAFGLALAFLVFAAVQGAAFVGGTPGSFAIVAATVVSAYMALNIGANDAANNMGPAVGARAITMAGAIALAACAEAAGALLAGDAVISTVSVQIIDPRDVGDADTLMRAMLSALLGAAIFVNIATFAGAPVSTTHSVVGGILGAGVMAAGVDAVNWHVMGQITISWVLSPLVGGVIAALVLALIRNRISYREDVLGAAVTWVPVFVGVLGGGFAAVIGIKGLGRIPGLPLEQSLFLGVAAGSVLWAILVPVIRRSAAGLENRMRSVKALFALPLVIAATLMSFAHGANDVANAVGPLTAIVATSESGGFGNSLLVPSWTLIIGALGLAAGLFLFGPRLIRRVGGQITKLNPIRSFCVATSAAITVILASALGLPVSSTHVAVGGVFGIGFYREWLAGRDSDPMRMAREERQRRKLVRRSHFLTIIAAWMVTVPSAAAISGLIFAVLR
ncbi:inorganic phosphate transporter [Lutimaribacter marinistellae]|uniref:Phosphate transporter n=1 Tax=Lutimaribacter marinistellae TaxID=1820329 RepID=A0ABV7TEE4_9RHOB